MQHKLIIQGRLPGLNDYLAAERITYRVGKKLMTKGNEMKQTHQDAVIWQIRQQMKGLHIDKPIVLKYEFFEPSKSRDLDNISAFAHKIIQDALVKANIIDNDGWKNIIGYVDGFYCDKENPRIEVYLQEVTE